MYDTKSLFILDQKSKIRISIVWFVEWKWFQRFIFLCIVINSVVLAMENYESRVNFQY